jgi:hypothetical protein
MAKRMKRNTRGSKYSDALYWRVAKERMIVEAGIGFRTYLVPATLIDMPVDPIVWRSKQHVTCSSRRSQSPGTLSGKLNDIRSPSFT